MIELVPLTAAHLDALARAPHRLDQAWVDRRDAAPPPGLALAACLDGRVLAAGGIAPLWPGVGEAWALFAPDAAAGFGCALTRQALRRLPALTRGLELRRVQCVVHARRLRARAWVEWLGFQAEGLLRGYGPDGADHWIYGMVG